MKAYTKKDMVSVVDAAGNELPDVPKTWIGTDLLPQGVKKASSSSSSSSSRSSRSSGSSSSSSGPAAGSGDGSSGDASS